MQRLHSSKSKAREAISIYQTLGLGDSSFSLSSSLSVAAASCISSGMAFFAYTPGSASFTATSPVALFAATFSTSRASHASHTSRLQKHISPVGVCVYLLLCWRDADKFSTQRCPLISH